MLSSSPIIANPPLELLIGTRKSLLARAQTDLALAALSSLPSSSLTYRIVPIETAADSSLSEAPLQSIGSSASTNGAEGAFTRELERSLVAGGIDLAVHSLKDMPTANPPGLSLYATLPREDPSDALVFPEEKRSSSGLMTSLADAVESLAAGTRVGTSSIRRKAQLLALNPHLDVQPIRGNVQTRLQKLQAGDYDVLVLAMAGLRRLGLVHVASATSLHDGERFMYAVGQGAIGLQAREEGGNDDEKTRAIVDALGRVNDRATWLRVTAERALLAQLHGGCSVPVSVHSSIADDGTFALIAAVYAPDGTHHVRASESEVFPQGDEEEDIQVTSRRAVELGARLAKALMDQGAEEILAKCPRPTRLAAPKTTAAATSSH